MSKLIQMLPKQITVGPRASPGRALAPAQAWSCPQLSALAKMLGAGLPPTAGVSWGHALYGLLEHAADAVIVVDMTVPMLPISYANGGFAQLTGWRVDEAVGRNCRFLQGKHTEGAALSQLISAVRQRTACKLRITNMRKDGSPFLNELSLHPVHDSSGAYRYNIGVLVDASAGGSSPRAEALRASLPTVFEGELDIPHGNSDYEPCDPIAQWKQYQPLTSKLIRLLWSTDPDGAMRKFLTLPAPLSVPAVSSIGKFLSTKAADDEKLLALLVTQEARGEWSAMAGRTDQAARSAGAASALSKYSE